MDSKMIADFSTPEGALQALEQAYVAGDIEAAVAAKNFNIEALEMLKNLKSMPNPESDLVAKAAHVLELSFRNSMQTRGFPDFSGVRCRVVNSIQIGTNLVEMSEECVFPNGDVAHEKVHAGKSGERWGIVVLPPQKV